MGTTAQYLHIVPVGTSLLLNYGWKRGQKLPRWQTLLESLKTGNPRQRSAELNALLPFVERGECTRVHLIPTATPECATCCRALKRFLQGRRLQVTGAEARDLLPANLAGPANQTQFNRGIRQFREIVFRAAAAARKDGATVMMNATGGLKAEVVIAALVAAQLNIPAYYIYESMVEPVFLPVGPLDPGVLATLRTLGQKGPTPAARLEPELCTRLEYEGLIKVSKRADGTPSSVRLTPYGRYWAAASPGRARRAIRIYGGRPR